MTSFSNFKPTVHKKNLLTAATFLFPVAGIGLLVTVMLLVVTNTFLNSFPYFFYYYYI